MNLSKIKYDGDITVTLKYVDGNADYEAVIRDRPHPDFAAALQALAPKVLEIVELKEVKEDTVDVRGVTFSESEDDRVTITALRRLSWTKCPLVLNTPNAPVEELPHGTATRLNTLKREAIAYLQGKRAQGNLFAGDGGLRSVSIEPSAN